ncbi:class I SAM-dependent methyltransferase [Coleofasciculus sp. FACHB-T130]|uniref:class I SAM-dependent methyltransferase n=1 Tax=Cyanophyceae TaxID=3028117 RepID=UPI0016850308|nr:class I SAM-dependent methyltransferase [Coleofasciculus sp. FACHB-T130]MBD1877959.1 class I SAM-dependent methyltransferase [Coleofasciculus sp. FACHB-T130]
MTNQHVFIFEGERAGNYDKEILFWVPGYELIHDLLQAVLQVRLPEESSLLISGSGSGKELEILGKANSSWRLLGVDPSPEMMNIASDRIQKAGLQDRVSLHQGIVSDLPEDILYDAATLILVMHFFPDDGTKLAMLRSITQRLKPGATFLLVDSYGESNSGQVERKLEILKNYVLKKGIPPEQVQQRLENIPRNIHLVPEERIVALLEEAGFGMVERFYSALLVGGWIAKRGE